jgi:hypothetical protein
MQTSHKVSPQNAHTTHAVGMRMEEKTCAGVKSAHAAAARIPMAMPREFSSREVPPKMRRPSRKSHVAVNA